jgi:phospholipase A1
MCRFNRRLICRLLLLLLLGLPIPTRADETAPLPVDAATETPALPPLSGPAAAAGKTEDPPTLLQRLAKGFSLHKPTYAIFTWGNRAAGLEDSELKFQFSFKQRLGESGFFVAYTQKSFWRVFDQSDSRPFRETDYNPEAFYRYARPTLWGSWGGDLGLEHESNGAREPTSRSWNRAYIAPYVEYGRLRAELKLWQRLSEEVKEDPADPTGDENPDIEEFYGHGELRLSCRVGKAQEAALMLRGNPRTGKGAVQLDYSVPITDGINLYGQLWSGYGESLIDYNRSLTTYGLGIRFRQ